MGHSFDMLTFDFLLKPSQPFTGLFFYFHFREHYEDKVCRRQAGFQSGSSSED